MARNPWRNDRPQYVARRGREDVAFLACDLNPPDLVIYEIFVALPFRGQGIGSRLVEKAVSEGRRNGCDRLLARPGQLSPDYPVEALTVWYRKRGFVAIPGNAGILQFALSEQ